MTTTMKNYDYEPVVSGEGVTVRMHHEGNLGYAADQVDTFFWDDGNGHHFDGSMTLAELLEAVQEAITEWGPEATVVAYQRNNGYGANYGALAQYGLFDQADSEDEE